MASLPLMSLAIEIKTDYSATGSCSVLDIHELLIMFISCLVFQSGHSSRRYLWKYCALLLKILSDILYDVLEFHYYQFHFAIMICRYVLKILSSWSPRRQSFLHFFGIYSKILRILNHVWFSNNWLLLHRIKFKV